MVPTALYAGQQPVEGSFYARYNADRPDKDYLALSHHLEIAEQYGQSPKQSPLNALWFDNIHTAP